MYIHLCTQWDWLLRSEQIVIREPPCKVLSEAVTWYMDLSSGSQHFPLELKSELQFSPLLFFFLNSSSSEIIHFQVTSAPLLFSHLHIALRFFFLSYFLPVSPQKGGQSSGRGSLGVKMALFCIITTYFFFFRYADRYSVPVGGKTSKISRQLFLSNFYKRIFESF